MEKRYRHVGYFNDIEDIEEMRESTPQEIIGDFLDGYGAFHEPSSPERPVERHLIDAEYGNCVREFRNYLVIMDVDNDDKENDFIDIYVECPAEPKINREAELVEVWIDRQRTPRAFAARVEDFMRDGFSREEALEYASGYMEMEIYFQPEQGLFLVESEAVESTDIFSPYTKEQYKEPDEGDE